MCKADNLKPDSAWEAKRDFGDYLEGRIKPRGANPRPAMVWRKTGLISLEKARKERARKVKKLA